jgi:hypothetical protein
MLPPEPESTDPWKLAAGFVAATAAVSWSSGTWLARFAMFIGGFSGSFFLTDDIVRWFGLYTHVNAIAWLVGIFSMQLAKKIVELISLVSWAYLLELWPYKRK